MMTRWTVVSLARLSWSALADVLLVASVRTAQSSSSTPLSDEPDLGIMLNALARQTNSDQDLNVLIGESLFFSHRRVIFL